MGVYNDVSRVFKVTFDMITGGPAACDDMLRMKTFCLYKQLVDSAAADTTAAYAATAEDQTSDAVYCPLACTIYQAKLMPFVALTASDTDYGTVTAVYDDGAGGSDTNVASLVTNVAGGSWVVGTAKAMTMATTGGVAVPAGSWLTFSIGKTGNGVAISPFEIVLVGKLT